jgi:nucleoside-diphosphate-sugar epimerase
VLGRCVVPHLAKEGHSVVGLARSPEKTRLLHDLGAEAVQGSLLDHDRLVAMFEGADAVCNLATRVPVGLVSVRPHAWRANDRLRTEGVRRVVEAARAAHVRRVVQESVSFLYADGGDAWIDEDSPVAITPATEPASVGESHVQDYACGSRAGVVLRFGTIVGDDPLTRFLLRNVRHGRPIGVGSPHGWAHLIHTDDLGSAVLAALGLPSGIYNVGAEPVRRSALVAGFAAAAGRAGGDFVGPFKRRVGGVRLEPMARSLRVSSARFSAQTGWRPTRGPFDASWLTPGVLSGAALP